VPRGAGEAQGGSEVLRPPVLQSITSLRLPRNKEAWVEAHSYFLAYPPLPSCIENLDIATATFQNNVYNYFMNEYGAHKPKIACRPVIRNTTVRAMRK